MEFISGMKNPDGSMKFEPNSLAERQALAIVVYKFNYNKCIYLDVVNSFKTGGPTNPTKKDIQRKNIIGRKKSFNGTYLMNVEFDFYYDGMVLSIDSIKVYIGDEKVDISDNIDWK